MPSNHSCAMAWAGRRLESRIAGRRSLAGGAAARWPEPDAPARPIWIAVDWKQRRPRAAELLTCLVALAVGAVAQLRTRGGTSRRGAAEHGGAGAVGTRRAGCVRTLKSRAIKAVGKLFVAPAWALPVPGRASGRPYRAKSPENESSLLSYYPCFGSLPQRAASRRSRLPCVCSSCAAPWMRSYRERLPPRPHPRRTVRILLDHRDNTSPGRTSGGRLKPGAV